MSRTGARTRAAVSTKAAVAARTAVATGLLAIAALTMSACSPNQTDTPYAASDGVRVSWEVGAPIKGENLLLLATAEGGEARVIGAFANSTGEDVEVQFGFPDGDGTAVTIPAGGTVLLNGEGDGDIVLDGVPAGPGATVTMAFVTDSQGTITVEVPVLDGTLEEYADLVP